MLAAAIGPDGERSPDDDDRAERDPPTTTGVQGDHGLRPFSLVTALDDEV
jgi:hypothetical protein